MLMRISNTMFNLQIIRFNKNVLFLGPLIKEMKKSKKRKCETDNDHREGNYVHIC